MRKQISQILAGVFLFTSAPVQAKDLKYPIYKKTEKISLTYEEFFKMNRAKQEAWVGAIQEFYVKLEKIENSRVRSYGFLNSDFVQQIAKKVNSSFFPKICVASSWFYQEAVAAEADDAATKAYFERRIAELQRDVQTYKLRLRGTFKLSGDMKTQKELEYQMIIDEKEAAIRNIQDASKRDVYIRSRLSEIDASGLESDWTKQEKAILNREKERLSKANSVGARFPDQPVVYADQESSGPSLVKLGQKSEMAKNAQISPTLQSDSQGSVVGADKIKMAVPAPTSDKAQVEAPSLGSQVGKKLSLADREMIRREVEKEKVSMTCVYAGWIQKGAKGKDRASRCPRVTEHSLERNGHVDVTYSCQQAPELPAFKAATPQVDAGAGFEMMSLEEPKAGSAPSGKNLVFFNGSQRIGPAPEKIYGDNQNGQAPILCNPVLFGLKDEKPLCVSASGSVTAECKRQSEEKGYDVLAVVKSNPKEFYRYTKRYETLCSSADNDLAEYFGSMGIASGDLERSVKDLASTCAVVRDQMAQLQQKYNDSSTGSGSNYGTQ